MAILHPLESSTCCLSGKKRATSELMDIDQGEEPSSKKSKGGEVEGDYESNKEDDEDI